jgi:hypothetical protein
MRLGLAAALLVVVVAGCGGTAANSARSPVAAVSPTSTAASSPSPSTSPTVTPSAAPLLVIADYTYTAEQVRLANLDANDTAVVRGIYDGVVGGQVIVVDGLSLKTLNRNGSVRKLGTLAAQPSGIDPGAISVKPDLSQWLYTVPDNSWTSRIHLGSATGDRVVATIPSPDGNAFYQAYAWTTTGTYFVKHATGIGGVGPFLEYNFPLARFDIATGRMTEVTPTCYVYAVLDEGATVCRAAYTDSHLQIRTQSGLTITMQVTLGASAGVGSAFARVRVSPDNSRLVASRNSSTGPLVNYQMAVAGLTETTANPFGAVDYVPDTWLRDGRLVADHQCWPADSGGGTCNAALDGTYIFSADGSTHSLFYKLKSGMVVSSI